MAKYTLGVLLLAFLGANAKVTSWKVAVYEHSVILDGYNSAPDILKANMNAFRRAAAMAGGEGAKLIVFPEYGLYDTRQTRQSIKPYLESIPDPKKVNWNPCKNPSLYPNTPVQYSLSCIAKANDLYLVANMAGKESCIISTDPDCPSDGQYQYNTNVVYSPSGMLISRYYKAHSYHESHFDTAPMEEIIFSTPFGKFGIFTSHDIVYREPAITLIENYNIRNIVFPTAWGDERHLMRAIQTNPSFARGNKVNLLTANLYNPRTSSEGSDIFTPDGAAENHYNLEVPNGVITFGNITPLDDIRGGTLIQKTFNYKVLKNRFGNVSLCYNDFCCHAYYKMARKPTEVYALGVFDGLKQSAHNVHVYVQICTLLKCPTFRRCGESVTDVKTLFKQFSLKGENFISPYVYPSVLAMQNGKHILQKHFWTYDSEKGLQTVKDKQVLLDTASLYSRVYSKDAL